MRLPAGETVTVQRASLVPDPYSLEPHADWSVPPVEITVPGCAFDPGTGTEPSTAWREGMSVTPTLYAPHGSDIRSTDRVVVRGVTYEVDGTPADWRSPWTGEGMGLVVPLSKFGG